MESRLDVDGAACIVWAVLLLMLPLNWVLSAFAAATVHELCHILAVICTKGRIYGICVRCGGIELKTSPMGYLQELVCALAGPAGSFALLGLLNFFPRIAVCAAVQGGFNLLPVYPLDGGRVLRSGCLLLFGEFWAERIQFTTQWIVFLLLSAGAWYVYLRFGQDISVLFLWAMVVYKCFRGKIPCKESKVAVQ